MFRVLDREAFEKVLGQWLQEQGIIPGEALAIDGKRLRGIHGEEVPGVHLIAAYTQQSGLVVGEQAVPRVGNELRALPELLAQLPMEGRVVTGDAQFTQREASREIVAQGDTTSGR